ncbi:MAG TPA: 2-dehydro-3-deoxygalactonokinase [Terriglobales bacterium]|jgi:2-dehydro-3-deoxygalactonokinase|nr:2-dehydro-3-deoxygalactonokinase [Terriglobales bacterium]
MASGSEGANNLCAIYVDMGTTNTRVWLLQRDRVVGCASQPIGIRDAARGDAERLRNCLRELIADVCAQGRRASEPCTPTHVAAAGMITSSLGLAEVPHIHPPAGLEELTAAARWHRFGNVTDLPILLVPGLRSSVMQPSVESIHAVDVMRGEETLCAGLIAVGIVSPPAVVLNLGSHWKAIRLGKDGKIQSSVTSLSGELMHVTQEHTILASSLPSGRPQSLSMEWMEAGMREQRLSGLARALFCVRLLQLENQGTPEDRSAFMAGAFIASDLDAFLSGSVIEPGMHVALVGNSALVESWQKALSSARVTSTVTTQQQAEAALLEALRRILGAAVAGTRAVSQQADAST